MERTHRIVIGVMGGARADASTGALAREVGRRVAERGAVLLTGGRTGVMEEASRGARAAGGLVVGVLPGRDAAETPPNPFVDVALFTGLGDGRNWVNVCACDAIIALDGGWGTLSEIALAMKNGKPVVALGAPNGSGALGAKDAVEGVPRVETPEEAVSFAFSRIERG